LLPFRRSSQNPIFMRVVTLCYACYTSNRPPGGKEKLCRQPLSQTALSTPPPQSSVGLLTSDFHPLSSVLCLSSLKQIQDTFGGVGTAWSVLGRPSDGIWEQLKARKTQSLPAFRWLDSPNRKSKIKNQKSQGRVSFWTRQLFLKNFFKPQFLNLVPCRRRSQTKAGV